MSFLISACRHSAAPNLVQFIFHPLKDWRVFSFFFYCVSVCLPAKNRLLAPRTVKICLMYNFAVEQQRGAKTGETVWLTGRTAADDHLRGSLLHMIMYNHPQTFIKSVFVFLGFFEEKKAVTVLWCIIFCLHVWFCDVSLLLFPVMNFYEPPRPFQDVIALLGIPRRARVLTVRRMQLINWK